MPLRINVPENFSNLFHKILENEPVENGNKLNLFSLKISSNAFSYANLVEELGDILTKYALSRSTYDDLREKEKYNTLVTKAKERLRKAESNEGELGEILLYSMLEAHLKAPKLLTKLELKTDPNHYVNGADGVHLLKKHNIMISMPQSGDPLENAVAERTNGILKTEWLYKMKIPTIEKCKEEMKRIISFYNTERPHMSIGNKTPEVVHAEDGAQKRCWRNPWNRAVSSVAPG